MEPGGPVVRWSGASTPPPSLPLNQPSNVVRFNREHLFRSFAQSSFLVCVHQRRLVCRRDPMPKLHNDRNRTRGCRGGGWLRGVGALESWGPGFSLSEKPVCSRLVSLATSSSPFFGSFHFHTFHPTLNPLGDLPQTRTVSWDWTYFSTWLWCWSGDGYCCCR